MNHNAAPSTASWQWERSAFFLSRRSASLEIQPFRSASAGITPPDRPSSRSMGSPRPAVSTVSVSGCPVMPFTG
ncbi:hypothetical protein [Streptomyces sp. SID12501]|uniref:Uncharacterized protein n=1 Tax=Streptomyces sp. SID12501 TaxID=2706042 RepID=A0A6B3C0D7_9ACTN|nr:hypothetical protein [Streptomyces sp. SID12501]NEC89952.1 hypothetical protein [Streptomyces sp. SID12501]